MATTFDSGKHLQNVREVFPDEVDDSVLIGYLKGSGLSIVQSTIVFARYRGMAMTEAKEIVVESVAWREDAAFHSTFHDVIESVASAESEVAE
ncbi:hypothetical protein [Micromonospora chokoriensis]|uniref:hypothetical protein n=1 Tax=Micromonospora chokoriensis TaxID=356851 RepID=UPI0012FDC4D0|nr:hypothetical protein [Micromonospora chokoriensis]